MPEGSVALSWKDIEKLAKDLAEKVRGSGFEADWLIGIANGGLVPLLLMTRALGAKNTTTISARSYDGKVQGDVLVTALPDIDLKGKKVLLIDETAEHGTTLRHVSDILKKQYEVGELRTAVLVRKNHCALEIDYHVMETSAWIDFPWDEASG